MNPKCCAVTQAFREYSGTSLAVQWLRLHTSTAGGTGSVPGQGTESLHAAWHGQKTKKERNNREYSEKIIY